MGEIAGALGVVASLLYLAVQVRQNARHVRSSAADTAVATLVNWLSPLLQNPDSWDVFWRGSLDLEGLSEQDRTRFLPMAFLWLKTVEGVYLKYHDGFLDPPVWEGWSVILHSYNQHPGIRAYWEERRPAFAASFGEWMDSAPKESQNFASMEELLTRKISSEASNRLTGHPRRVEDPAPPSPSGQ